MSDILGKIIDAKVDVRLKITEYDQSICESYQKVYENNLWYLGELMKLYKAAEAKQDEINKFVGDSDAIVFIIDDLDDSLKEMRDSHERFVRCVVRYFTRHYSCVLDERGIIDYFIPERPQGGFWSNLKEEQALDEYNAKMDLLELKWEEIVEKIIIELDGYSFAELAEKQLMEKCLNAATDSRGKNFTITGKIMRFNCKCNYNYSDHGFTVHDSFLKILWGLHHFCCNQMELPMNYPFRTYYTSYPHSEWYPGYEQVDKMKLFKNGRIDLTFKDANTALQFARKYLGYIPESNEAD